MFCFFITCFCVLNLGYKFFPLFILGIGLRINDVWDLLFTILVSVKDLKIFLAVEWEFVVGSFCLVCVSV